MNSLPGVHVATIADQYHCPREVIDTSQAFQGAVVNVRLDDVKLTPTSQPVRRDVVEHPGAVAVLAVNDADEVAFVRQYRHPVGAELWEIPAGLLDQEGEDPAVCARRELAEEVDLTCESLTPLLNVALSAGGSTERIHIYLARGLSPCAQTFTREAEEAEFELTWVPRHAAIRAARAGKITSAATVLALLVSALDDTTRQSPR
ncbi:MAG: NUDIX hydrolase [Bowdeniella nasicola]|nr:NUDIX hydrolase [Bowdeniella nasicola]